MSSCLWAQTGGTIFGRCADYWYPQWYDQCGHFIEDPGLVLGDVPTYFSVDNVSTLRTDWLLIDREVIEEPLVVKGIAVMVTTPRMANPPLTSDKMPEWVLVCHVDSIGMPIDTLAMGRWDNVQARTMILPQNLRSQLANNATNSMQIIVYDVLFDSTIAIMDDIAIVATFNSNEFLVEANRYKTMPTAYAYITDYSAVPCERCFPSPLSMLDLSNGSVFSTFPRHFSPFLFMPDSVNLTVLTADSLMGTAAGSGTYRSDEPAVVTATAAPFCRFAGWSDGSTDNSRVMYLYQDSTITARFVTDSSNYVRVMANNTEWGSVSGTGIYPYGQSATIAATAAEGYLFTEWADGDTNNPRTVMPVSDTVFTALFDPLPMGIGTADITFTLHPNPTTGVVAIACTAGSHLLQLYDGAGRMMLSHAFDGDSATVDISLLPAGIYTAVLRTDGIKTTKTLIKL